MKKLMFPLVITVLIAMVACNNAKQEEKSASAEAAEPAFDLAAARTSIESMNAKFIENFKKGDSAAVAGLYTPDAWILPPNMETVKGSAIAGFWGGFMKMGVKDLKLITDDVAGNKDQLVETGRYEIIGDGNKTMDKGKYVVAWQPSNGEWKLHRDIFNSDMPTAPAK
jgi:ketosteroid isomerase-like protein